jgi:hypothetical protein
VRGSLRDLMRGESPSPEAFGFDLSPQAGRGDSSLLPLIRQLALNATQRHRRGLDITLLAIPLNLRHRFDHLDAAGVADVGEAGR